EQRAHLLAIGPLPCRLLPRRLVVVFVLLVVAGSGRARFLLVVALGDDLGLELRLLALFLLARLLHVARRLLLPLRIGGIGSVLLGPRGPRRGSSPRRGAGRLGLLRLLL